MIIREATIDDLGTMLKWRNAADFNFCGIMKESELSEIEYLSEIKSNINKEYQELTLIGLQDGTAIGMLWADFLTSKNKKCISICLYRFQLSYRFLLVRIPFKIRRFFICKIQNELFIY